MSPRRARDYDSRSGVTPTGPIVRTRWVLLIAVSYIVLFGSVWTPQPWPHYTLVVSLLVSNFVLKWLLAWGFDWKRLRWVFATADVGFVTLAVTVVGERGTELYLVYFIVLMLATVVPRIGSVAGLTIVGAGLYGFLLYVEMGPALFRDAALLVRMPFLLGIALYFATVVQDARGDEGRTDRLAVEARSIAQRAKHLAKKQYRLEALAEIGRLGLSGVRTEPGNILSEIVQRVQKVIGVDRCSLVVFEEDSAHAYVAASGDDPTADVRVIEMEAYPELQIALQRGEITELYPGHPPDLWNRVQQCLPPANPFRSFLIVPIQRRNRLLGAFYLRDARADRRFDEDDRNFCWTAAMMTAAFLYGHDLLEQLRIQSRRDGLTGLLNFQAFTEEAGDVLRTDRDHNFISLVVADLDNLKVVNDRWGHIAGNRLIITVGQHFTKSLPDAMALCRYGGDEFVALVPSRKTEIGERLEAFLKELGTEPTDLPKSPRISIGIAEHPTDGREVDQLVEQADQAMYLAKSAGGHRICLSGESLDSKEWNQAVLEAVVNVEGRRHSPDAESPMVDILAPLEGTEGQSLDSPIVIETLKKLMQAVEAKDPYTLAHSRAVAKLARRLAEAMAFPEDELNAIEIAGLVHDVGKIGVPDEILGKPSRLSDAERRVVERHPEVAARLLEQIPPLKPVVPYVAYHQERWDGSGYPTGMEGRGDPGRRSRGGALRCVPRPHFGACFPLGVGARRGVSGHRPRCRQAVGSELRAGLPRAGRRRRKRPRPQPRRLSNPSRPRRPRLTRPSSPPRLLGRPPALSTGSRFHGAECMPDPTRWMSWSSTPTGCRQLMLMGESS